MALLSRLRLPWRLQQWVARQRLEAQRRYYDRKILSTRPYPTGAETADFEVHVLLGHRYVGMCLWSVKSFLHFSGRKYRVVLHDDGSLTQKDVLTLTTHLPNVAIISRAEADRRMERALGNFPNALRYRFGNRRSPTVASSSNPYVFSLKLLDFNLLTDASKILALDTDVLFFKRPNEIIEWVEGPGQQSSHYCLELWVPIRNERNSIVRFEKKTERPLAFNSGLICLYKSAFDISELDQWLGRHIERVEREYTFEQQAYNFLVQRTRGHGPLPETYTFNFNDAACVATHFGIKSLFFANLPRMFAEFTA